MVDGVIKDEGASNVKTAGVVSTTESAWVEAVGGVKDTSLGGSCWEVTMPTGDGGDWTSPSPLSPVIGPGVG